MKAHILNLIAGFVFGSILCIFPGWASTAYRPDHRLRCRSGGDYPVQ